MVQNRSFIYLFSTRTIQNKVTKQVNNMNKIIIIKAIRSRILQELNLVDPKRDKEEKNTVKEKD